VRRRGDGTVARELRAKQHLTVYELLSPYSRKRLSADSRDVLRDAHEQLTGMRCGVNEYWLAETLSEAVEAAEELGL
jgi:hypothetical protein